MKLRPAVFCDRDGTVIDEKEYLAEPDGVRLLPGVVEAMRALKSEGFALVIVTNQSGIARGLYSERDYEAVAARVEQVLSEGEVLVDSVKYCPHHPDVTGPCRCRKPGTGMYEDAARELGIDLPRSYYVGDKITDVLPAAELGGQGVLVRTGYGADLGRDVPTGVVVVDDLPAAAEFILANPRR